MTDEDIIKAATVAAEQHKDVGVRLRVLLPCNTQIFNRICSNMPNGTLMKMNGTAVYEGREFQVCEFFKPKN